MAPESDPGRQDTQPTMAPPESGVRVRMYRQRGLGDCFLLAFRAGDGSGRYMLIDCGVFFLTSGASQRMGEIALDIEKATGGRLDVLVATHEHWDHLSGFQFAKEVFDRLTIGEVWVAWTEDLSHPLATRLREKRAAALKALAAAVTQLRASGDPEAERIEEVLGFHGGFDAELGVSGTQGQLAYVRERGQPPRYLRPGEAPIGVPEVGGIRIYVLGPPEDEGLLRRSSPSRRDSEVYEERLELDEESALSIAALYALSPEALSEDEKELLESSYPFDRARRIPWEEVKDSEHYGFFKSHYGFGEEGEGHGPSWRRIDTDWLRATGTLALQLDSHTNNTSLALAIELVDGGRVLLFPADAQVGNWLSWKDLEWSREGETLTGSELIKRTVLYKVGHHGSHNATLREHGLELMTSPELVAMIPVDKDQAQQKRWAMPFPALLERLEEKTKGRILRADEGIPKKPDNVIQSEWNVFLARTAEDDLWLEYTVLA